MKTKLKLKPLSEWGLDNLDRPFLISGPCSAETEAQVLETAHALASQNISVFRAGIWKPRTRPNTFEGVGSDGLKWLSRVKEETGLKVATEVANAKHVYEALKHNIDVLWIGARTTVNPFAVQEIADALKGVDIPVFVKNPINPDLELWIGALERFNKSGITKLAAIHRGFSSYGDSAFRNAPNWQIPIELKRRFPELLIINDPSHIGGKRSLIKELSQKAMDLDFDGLMIEVHPNPDDAWSDSSQQINPGQFEELIRGLKIRSKGETQQKHSRLSGLRKKIDYFDHELMEILEARMKVACEIGEFKRDNNMVVLQNNRWNEVIEQSITLGNAKGLSPDLISKIFKAIHQESINNQTDIINKAIE
ncbi:MAG: bifunctional 3-deoxy-7-phosphoheptulonate synthase/chorismate mutase type II [Bacteroidales bacterium]|jgi:chorismate mutase|nr:bifunctional 3-deoxy-7-phosphoheptulonate synthase/chorismate mutase type II [Bacteroidales bacterium]